MPADDADDNRLPKIDPRITAAIDVMRANEQNYEAFVESLREVSAEIDNAPREWLLALMDDRHGTFKLTRALKRMHDRATEAKELLDQLRRKVARRHAQLIGIVDGGDDGAAGGST
jgi:DNA repair ATPase RecN